MSHLAAFLLGMGIMADALGNRRAALWLAGLTFVAFVIAAMIEMHKELRDIEVRFGLNRRDIPRSGNTEAGEN